MEDTKIEVEFAGLVPEGNGLHCQPKKEQPQPTEKKGDK
jgi:hypothetical protein